MVENIPDSDYQQLQHFISDSPWDAMEVMSIVSKQVYATLSTPDRPNSSLGLIIDESGWEKSGKNSVGVARQYIGQVGKVCNGQVGVFAALTDGVQTGQLQGRLYLPKEWTGDKKRCSKAKIPAAQQNYLSKPELSVEILKSLPESVKYDWVGGDDLYGNSFTLRNHLYEQCQAFVVDVSENLGVYQQKPQLYLPTPKQGRGRKPIRHRCDEKPVQLKKLLSQIPDEDWKVITHRNGTKGPMTRKAYMLPVHIWKPDKGQAIESLQLLISSELDGSEVKYSLCYQPDETYDIDTVLYRQMQRYWIERSFQEVKQQLGMHQYQVRSWRAWYHHIALTLMVLHFMLQVQKEDKKTIPLLSIPDIKLIFAKKLSNRLDTDEGIITAIRIRHRKRKKDIERHMSKSKLTK